MTKTIIYTTGTQDFTSPSQLDDTKIRFAGTAPYPDPTTPMVNLTGSLATYSLDKVEVPVPGYLPNYGFLEFDPETLAIFTQGLRVSHGTLWTRSQQRLHGGWQERYHR